MTIRTISQLPSIEYKVVDNSFIEISEPIDIKSSNEGGYVSKKVSYDKIKTQLNNEIGDELNQKYSMSEDNNPISVLSVKQRVDSIYDGNSTLITAKFKNNPIVQSPSVKPNDNEIPTVGQIINTIIPKSTPFNIGSDSKYDSAKTQTGFYENPDMFFKIDSGTKESNILQAKHTGNAVIYGWLADNGSTTSTNAWVGLFGLINTKWILLQLQPWIIGSKSSVLQYVGFNVPIKQGLELKIVTGFPVNGSNSTPTGDIGWGINVVNTFAGYVIY